MFWQFNSEAFGYAGRLVGCCNGLELHAPLLLLPLQGYAYADLLAWVLDVMAAYRHGGGVLLGAEQTALVDVVPPLEGHPVADEVVELALIRAIRVWHDLGLVFRGRLLGYQLKIQLTAVDLELLAVRGEAPVSNALALEHGMHGFYLYYKVLDIIISESKMPFLDSIIPPSVDPFIRNVINVLVGIHIFAFLLYVYLLVRSSKKSSTDEFRDQYRNLETKVAAQKQRLNKHE